MSFPLSPAWATPPSFPLSPAWERVRVRWRIEQRVPDRLHNRLNISQDVMIPEMQDMESMRLQPGGAFGIPGGMPRVLPLIELDNQLPFETHRIYDESAQGLLPAKLVSVELPATKMAPQGAFPLCGLLPQGSGTLDVHGRSFSGIGITLTLPSPIKGEGREELITVGRHGPLPLLFRHPPISLPTSQSGGPTVHSAKCL